MKTLHSHIFKKETHLNISLPYHPATALWASILEKMKINIHKELYLKDHDLCLLVKTESNQNILQ